jgi:hypothetical protein
MMMILAIIISSLCFVGHQEDIFQRQPECLLCIGMTTCFILGGIYFLIANALPYFPQSIAVRFTSLANGNAVVI